MRRIVKACFMMVPFLIAFFAITSADTLARADDWPEWLGTNREGVWRETGLIHKFPAGGPVVRWRAPVGTGYSGPSVADGRVYVMDRERARDKSGKPLRVTREGVPGLERTLCLNADDGKLVWKDE